MNVVKPLQAKAYEYIKGKILSGELKPDILYSETRIAKELSISRTPLRDAIQSLSQDGYITIVPSKGFMIRKLTRKALEETIEIRCAIEGFCIYQVARDHNGQRKQDLIKCLQDCLTNMESAMNVNGEDVVALAEFISFDHKFHLSMIEYVNNEEFYHQFQRIHFLVQQTSESALTHRGRIRETFDEHVRMLQWIMDGESAKAYEEMIAHLMRPLMLLGKGE